MARSSVKTVTPSVIQATIFSANTFKVETLSNKKTWQEKKVLQSDPICANVPVNSYRSAKWIYSKHILNVSASLSLDVYWMIIFSYIGLQCAKIGKQPAHFFSLRNILAPVCVSK